MSSPVVQPPRRVGGAVSQAPHTVDPAAVAEPPVRTSWTTTVGQVALDALSDVDAPPAVEGVLERQADQVVRPVTRTALIADHVNSTAPHPAYDDLPSLTLLFENGLV